MASLRHVIPPQDIHVSRVLFTLRWKVMTMILLVLPVFGLFFCLITSLIFHADHINNTICQVYNFLPSISAVTGVSPQRYLWRICVALHISPRLLVAWVSRAHYAQLALRVHPTHRPTYEGLVSLAFGLNITELVSLCGVTYISNKENYPVHEKLFSLFMLSSLMYMLVVVRLNQSAKDTLSPQLKTSFTHKKWLFGVKLAATAGLMFFFWRHRMYCQPKAFSWFSLCEYVIASCNILFHVSVAMDFSEDHLIVGHIASESSICNSGSSSSSHICHSETSTSTSTRHFSSSSSCDTPESGSSDSFESFMKNGRVDGCLSSAAISELGMVGLHPPRPSSASDGSCPMPHCGDCTDTLSQGSVRQVLNTIHEIPESHDSSSSAAGTGAEDHGEVTLRKRDSQSLVSTGNESLDSDHLVFSSVESPGSKLSEPNLQDPYTHLWKQE